MADVQHRITDIENEVKVLKNEIKAILLDVREQYLNAENPFALAGHASAGPSTTVNIGQPAGGGGSQTGHETPGASPVPQETTPITEEPITEEKSTEKSELDSKEAAPGETDAGSSADVKPTDEDETSARAEKRGRKGASDTASLPSLGPSTEEEDEEEWQPQGGKRGKKAAAGFLPSLGPSEEDALGRRGKQAAQYRGGRKNGDGITLITIAGLSKWVDESTEKIGKERTEVMVEASHMVGHVSTELKELLVKLVHLAQPGEPKRGKITTKDYLGVIAQLDNLLGYGSESEAALLSILADSREPSYG